MYSKLTQYISRLVNNFNSIPQRRKEVLQQIAQAIQSQRYTHQESQLIFICTHNSRRSHFGQIWAAVAAYYYGIENLKTFSGGTEATAFNPRAVATLEKTGLKIINPGGKNPEYEVRFADKAEAMHCFSKTYDHPTNPQKNFIALMTCDEADQNCPVVLGTEYRFAIPYRDPKEADGTDEETRRYEERCQQIAIEMFYLISLLRK
ncbi:protein-tyrosine-phosphatase [Catalinimonas sp. 4WD22]|uniref:protein-tyrosine-phosphatase n=1 Tax=Catalinimonas locisalis TaxID=3133978 RepID=UPI0031019FCA